MILFKDKYKPLKNPYFLNASKEYSEQVGKNLQLGGKEGEIIFR